MKLTIGMLARQMHEVAESYHTDKSLTTVELVKFSLNQMETYKKYLTPFAQNVHRRLIESMEEDSTDVFMNNVLTKCCGYHFIKST